MASTTTLTVFFLVLALGLVGTQAGCPGMAAFLDDERDLQVVGPGDGSGLGIGRGIIGRLFSNRLDMNRTVDYFANGTIVALTESDVPDVAQLLKEHLANMQYRVANGLQARNWDPFFVEWFDRYTEFTVDVVNTTKGVEVTMSAFTDCGQALLDGHTAVVDLFVAVGLEEGEKPHDVPVICLTVPETTPVPTTSTPTLSPTEAPSESPETEIPSDGMAIGFWGLTSRMTLTLAGAVAFLAASA